jgi:radical SAM family uncharacterized protein/radical SAM-linked protein
MENEAAESPTTRSDGPVLLPGFDHPYAAFVQRVLKPGRYIGGEHGQRAKDWQSVQCRVCLAFPDVYDIGMSHLGYRILYKLFNDHAELLAERCYAPWQDMHGEILKHGELLRSLESSRPLCDFDVIGFSLQFELTYTNVLAMLQLGGVPLRSAARGDDDPLVIAGGPVATHAEPMAAFLDVIAIGDGEELALEIALTWSRLKREGVPRHERLLALSKLQGAYVPSLYPTHVDERSGFEVVDPSPEGAPFPVERRLLEDISRFPFPDDGPVGGPEAIFDRVSIEVARGCTEGCRFCQAGMIYRPVRERSPQQIVEAVERALKNSGHDSVSLTALSTADVSCIDPLIRRLVEKTAPERVSLSVASLRAYGLSEDLLDEMRRVRTGGLTFAPEAGTQRMRNVINKNVTEEQLLETAERIFSRGFDSMKLYFMIGLPTEEDDDVRGIVHVGRNALGVAKRLGNKRAKVTISVSTHVPKPHTPFQWCAQDALPEIKRKQALLRQEVGRDPRLALRVHDSPTSVLEGVLARGDRRLGDVIERAFLHGAMFDSWEESLRLDAWQEAFRFFGVDTERYTGTLQIDARVPWDHIDIGLEQGFLAREYRKALKDRLSPPCGKVAGAFVHHTNVEAAEQDQRRLVCYDCGVACDLTQMREQRIGFLHDMGAEKQLVSEKRMLPIVKLHRHHHTPEAHRPPQLGERQERWRLRFEKLGPTAMLGHLDFVRELVRVVRRGGLRMHYTQGYHPKPRLSFGPALSLGIASLDEYVDIDLLDPPDGLEIVRRLGLGCSVGLRFLEASALTREAPTLGASIVGADYVLAFPEASIGAGETLSALVNGFMQREEITVKRVTKGLGRKIDVRRFVQRLAVGDQDALESVRRAGIAGRLTTLVTSVALGPTGSVKPAEIVEALFGDGSPPFQAIRTRTRLEIPGNEADREAPRAAEPFVLSSEGC